QHSVQKSSTTIFPRRSRSRIGPAVFNHASPPSSGSQLTTAFVTRFTMSAAARAAFVAEAPFSALGASSSSFLGASFFASSPAPWAGNWLVGVRKYAARASINGPPMTSNQKRPEEKAAGDLHTGRDIVDLLHREK